MSVVAPPAPVPTSPPDLGRAGRSARTAGERSSTWAIVAVLLSAVATGVVGAGGVDLSRMDDLGLVRALPPVLALCPVLLTIGFCAALNQRRLRPWLVGAHVLALVVLLHGLPALVEPVARFPTSWVHTGFVDQIARHGTTLPLLDARFSWPGFFSLGALLTSIAGTADAVPFLPWVPVATNLAVLAPLWAIASSTIASPRVRWTVLWLFPLVSWVGQDYFSPQGFSFFLALVVLAVVLRVFPGEPAGARPRTVQLARRFLDRLPVLGAKRDDAQPPLELRPGQKAGLVAAVIALGGVLAISHQLTPFELVVMTTVLAVGGWSRLRSLPVLLAAVAMAWICFGAVVYWSGHIASVLGGVGAVGQTVDSNVGARLLGSPEHSVVVWARLVLAAAVFGLAALGVLRRARAGRSELALALLALVPLPLAAQGYGGEAALRAYLFASPFAAVLAARAFNPTDRRPRPRAVWALGLASLALAGGFVLARYGNERFESFTTGELATVERLYDLAPRGATLVATSFALPWKGAHVDDYRYRVPWPEDLAEGPADAVVPLLAEGGEDDAYLIVTRAQEAHGEALYGLEPGWGDALVDELVAEHGLRVVHRSADGTIVTGKTVAPDGAAAIQAGP